MNKSGVTFVLDRVTGEFIGDVLHAGSADLDFGRHRRRQAGGAQRAGGGQSGEHLSQRRRREKLEFDGLFAAHRLSLYAHQRSLQRPDVHVHRSAGRPLSRQRRIHVQAAARIEPHTVMWTRGIPSRASAFGACRINTFCWLRCWRPRAIWCSPAIPRAISLRWMRARATSCGAIRPARAIAVRRFRIRSAAGSTSRLRQAGSRPSPGAQLAPLFPDQNWRGGSTLIVFALAGGIASEASFLLFADPGAGMGAKLAGRIEAGEKVFAQSCATGYCHGARGAAAARPGWRRADSIRPISTNTVMRGLPGTAMPAFGTTLSRADLVAVVAYVATLNGIANPSISAGPGGRGEQPQTPLSEGAEQGRALFFDAVRGFGRCSTCHEVNGIGISVATPIAKFPPMPRRCGRWRRQTFAPLPWMANRCPL